MGNSSARKLNRVCGEVRNCGDGSVAFFNSMFSYKLRSSFSIQSGKWSKRQSVSPQIIDFPFMLHQNKWPFIVQPMFGGRCSMIFGFMAIRSIGYPDSGLEMIRIGKWIINWYLAIFLVTFLGWLSDPFKGESWPLTFGNKNVTWNHLVSIIPWKNGPRKPVGYATNPLTGAICFSVYWGENITSEHLGNFPKCQENWRYPRFLHILLKFPWIKNVNSNTRAIPPLNIHFAAWFTPFQPASTKKNISHTPVK